MLKKEKKNNFIFKFTLHKISENISNIGMRMVFTYLIGYNITMINCL